MCVKIKNHTSKSSVVFCSYVCYSNVLLLCATVIVFMFETVSFFTMFAKTKLFTWQSLKMILKDPKHFDFWLISNVDLRQHMATTYIQPSLLQWTQNFQG